MKILITKGKNRNILTCQRNDGSLTSENLGPDIPYHDIAHYVVETKFNITNGFYGKIKSGMSISELSDKEIIKQLDSEAWLSEIMARNLQSIGSGAATVDHYIELVKWEAENINGIRIPKMNLKEIKEMKKTFDSLCEKWYLISENEQLNLEFKLNSTSKK